MGSWLRRLLDVILGHVSGKPGRYDKATRMAMDADFGEGAERTSSRGGPPIDADPLEELLRLSKEGK